MTNQTRRRFWIDPVVQLQMVAMVLLLVVATIFLITFSVFHGLSEASQSTHQVFQSMDWVRDSIRGPIIISSLISVLASTLIALVWSHRYAGPLRVLSAAVARIGRGNLAVPVRIRKHDTHQDLVNELAQMQERLRERLGTDLRSLQSSADRLKAALPELSEDARRSAQDIIAELEAIGSRYQL